MNDVTFGTWSAAASPLTIEYSLVVVEEIRHEVAEGFQKLSRGGIEVGGVLYGVKEGQTVRVMAIRPATCEHAGGPTFRLSEKDRASLQDQIRLDRQDQRLEGLICVGWYVSHTRTEIALSESDQEIFSSYFAQPWQVTLVIRPSRGGNMRAGFFVWEPDATVKAASSYAEFNFPDRLAAVFGDNRGDNRGFSAERDRSSLERRGPSRAPRTANIPDQTAAAVPASTPGSETRPHPQNSVPTSTHAPSGMTTLFGEPVRNTSSEPVDYTKPPTAEHDSAKGGAVKNVQKWIWLVVALIVIAAAAVAGTRFLNFESASETIALNVLEREGQLNIEWNSKAAPVSRAARGTLEIVDGPQTRTIPLKSSDLSLGKFSYKRETGDIQVRMILETADGNKVQEASRFLGPPPAQGNSTELKALQQSRDDLDAEVTRLKQSNEQQAQRIQQLERTLKILQTRPGVQQ